jgi:hypothetical protein
MKIWTRLAMVSMMALAIPACAVGDLPDESDEGVTESGESVDDAAGTGEDVGEAEQALECQWNLIYHYNYSDSSGTYRWDVSYNYSTGKWYVDERRIGGGFYKQYNLTPQWIVCPSSPQTISLKNGGTTLTGPHNCLPNLKEEVHLEKQRLLVRQSPFAEYVCFE